MPDRWLQVQIQVPRDAVAAAEASLTRLGALVSWTEAASSDEILEPEPGQAPLWKVVRVTGLFPLETPVELLQLGLSADLGTSVTPASDIVLDRDWDAEWRRQLKPLRFGRRLWICPGTQPCPDPTGVAVLLEPGLAFGTGTHPSTAMCLAWLDGEELAGRTVLDYGCGSGLLAIAALALGASCAVGVDIDPQALTASRDNGRRNGCDDRLVVCLPGELRSVPGTRPFDVLVANILFGPLIRLAPGLRACAGPGTRVALSGILAVQAAEVVAAFRPWVQLRIAAGQEGWVLLDGTTTHQEAL